jgi:hypothetical protein
MDGLERSIETSNQLKEELLNSINRYCKEGDLTYFQILGVLETVKDDVKDRRIHGGKRFGK